MSIVTKVANKTGYEVKEVVTILDTFCVEIGWDEIRAFNAESRKGQSIREDAGGYMIRCIKALLCGRVDEEEVITYKKAAKALVEAAREER